MKKFLSVIFVVALVAVMALTMTACVSVPQDPDKAVENLKSNDYVAVKYQSLLAGTAISLMEGYLDAEDLDVKASDLDCAVTGIKGEEKEDSYNIDFIVALYFKEADKAKAIESKVKDAIKDAKAELEESYNKLSDEEKESFKEMYEEQKTYFEKFAVGRSGVALVFGTKNAVKAAN